MLPATHRERWECRSSGPCIVLERARRPGGRGRPTLGTERGFLALRGPSCKAWGTVRGLTEGRGHEPTHWIDPTSAQARSFSPRCSWGVARPSLGVGHEPGSSAPVPRHEAEFAPSLAMSRGRPPHNQDARFCVLPTSSPKATATLTTGPWRQCHAMRIRREGGQEVAGVHCAVDPQVGRSASPAHGTRLPSGPGW